MVTPQYNPSMALIGGWPFVQVAGDGNLGNAATLEVDARENPSSKNSATIVKAQNQTSAKSGGRII